MCDNTLEEFDLETEAEGEEAQVEQAARLMQEKVPVRPFMEMLTRVPIAQRLNIYEALLKAAAEQLTNGSVEVFLLKKQLAGAQEAAEVRSGDNQREGFGRAIESVRASLAQWPEGACDQEIARLVSLIVHKAVTDQAGALWVGAAMLPGVEQIGEEFLVAVRRVDLPPSMLTSKTAYKRVVAVWHGDQGWVATDGQTRLAPDYYHSLPKNPHPVFGKPQAMTNRGTTFLNSLTPKEEKFLVPLVTSAVPLRQVAATLGTTEQVVKNYARQLYHKAKVSNREGLMVFCFKHGVVQCPCGGAGTIPAEAITAASRAAALEVCSVYYVAAPRGNSFANSKEVTIAIMVEHQIIKALEALRG